MGTIKKINLSGGRVTKLVLSADVINLWLLIEKLDELMKGKPDDLINNIGTIDNRNNGNCCFVKSARIRSYSGPYFPAFWPQ